MNAIETLGKIDGTVAIKALVELLTDNHPLIPEKAVTALRSIGTPEAIDPIVPILVGQLRTDDRWKRMGIVTLLRNMEMDAKSAEPAFVEALDLAFA